MMNSKRPFRRIIFPATLLFSLLVLLMGCLYIPTFEHVDSSTGSKDFRPLLGDGSDNKPIAPGRTTKDQIISLLGKPDRQSENGLAMVYFISTRQGIWVEPQCFEAFSANQTMHCLSLRFDQHRELIHLKTFQTDFSKRAGIAEIFYPGESIASENAKLNALELVNQDNGTASTTKPYIQRYENPSPYYIFPYASALNDQQ
jgi:hypothetical protein